MRGFSRTPRTWFTGPAKRKVNMKTKRKNHLIGWRTCCDTASAPSSMAVSTSCIEGRGSNSTASAAGVRGSVDSGGEIVGGVGRQIDLASNLHLPNNFAAGAAAQ